MKFAQPRRIRDFVTVVLAGAFMLGTFALVGGLGMTEIADAAPATSITSISVSATCGTLGGFTGTVTLDGSFSGTVVLGLFDHIPGTSIFADSTLRADATFTGGNTATYNFPSFTFAGSNTYRIQVINSDGLSGATVKSNSVPHCTGTTTTTTTTTTTSTTPTSSTTTGTTSTTTTGTTSTTTTGTTI